ncbi:MAG: hypothetical protein Sylvanvirus15_15 [Sylvanvirus sp.]|uniref:Uncharacterized protein n=1 Tax=Sylvanvirus sp. TaxID=2487774 RepID=A0A3G5AKV3_9VIRU|nr:MAG: hypothetical protein Sylvanvirus15_15 [Sylvanvirus sp.]
MNSNCTSTTSVPSLALTTGDVVLQMSKELFGLLNISQAVKNGLFTVNNGMYSPTVQGIALLANMRVSPQTLFTQTVCATPALINFVPITAPLLPANQIESNGVPLSTIQVPISGSVPPPVVTAFVTALNGDVLISLPANPMVLSDATQYWSARTRVQPNGLPQPGYTNPVDGTFWTNQPSTTTSTTTGGTASSVLYLPPNVGCTPASLYFLPTSSNATLYTPYIIFNGTTYNLNNISPIFFNDGSGGFVIPGSQSPSSPYGLVAMIPASLGKAQGSQYPQSAPATITVCPITQALNSAMNFAATNITGNAAPTPAVLATILTMSQGTSMPPAQAASPTPLAPNAANPNTPYTTIPASLNGFSNTSTNTPSSNSHIFPIILLAVLGILLVSGVVYFFVTRKKKTPATGT